MLQLLSLVSVSMEALALGCRAVVAIVGGLRLSTCVSHACRWVDMDMNACVTCIEATYLHHFL